MFRKLDSNTKQLFDKKVLNKTTSLELVISEKCQNNCKYCYRTYKHDTSNIFSLEPSIVKSHIDKFLDIIQDDGTFFNQRSIELYGGDPLLDYQKAIEILKIVDTYKPDFVVLATNARLLSELTDHDIDNFINSIDTKIHCSLSVDGDPSETNRPLSKIGKMLGYNEKIDYKRLLKISRKYNFGFHPMLSFTNSDKWLDTVKFFFHEMGLVPYLLEVRHALSKEDAVKSVGNLKRIRLFYENEFKDNPDQAKFCIKKSNTLRCSIIPRGLGCSALTTLHIMPNGDMPFCHRLVDPPWVYGNVNYGFDISKVVSFTSIYNHRNLPECIICPIRDQCSGQCQGACYEYWGDPWMTIPSVCDYTRLKFYVFLKSFPNSSWAGITKKGKLEKSVFNIFDRKDIDMLIDLQ
jgi:radical SAM protein with 4Fe4S-binding SPASM domain